MDIGLKDIRKEFIKLDFDEDKHVYFVDNKPLKASVSELIKKYYTPFNADEVAGRKALQTGIPKETFLQDWKAINKESIDRGHRVHTFGEYFPYRRTKMSPSCPQEEAIVKFWNELPEHIILVGVEIRMYHKTKGYAGTADILLFDTMNQTYIIADYKTNKDLFKNFMGKKMINGFEHKFDMPFSHYEIQLSHYQILLEQVMGIKVSRRIVIHLQMDGEYKMYDCEDVRHLLN